MKKAFSFLLVVGTALATLGIQCPQGGPAIDQFVLLYDIVAAVDGTQAVEWQVTKGASVTLTVQDENNNVVDTRSSLPASSNGLHHLAIQNYPADKKYKVILNASNSAGKVSDYREFLLVGRQGLWYSFIKWVKGPKENAWFGFKDEVISVTHSQGINDNETISVSENVKVKELRWTPDLWADREGCTSPGLYRMNIRQLTLTLTDLMEGTIYPFPVPQWNVVGQYYCTVNWAPCNFGWQGATRTYDQVSFYLELNATGI